MTMLCANNHPNREGARFCQTCGAALIQATPAFHPARALVRAPVHAMAPRVAFLPQAAARVPARSGVATAIPLVLIVCGGLLVIVAFFLPWLAFSLPVMSMILGPSTTMTISGYEILMNGPGSYRSVPVVLVVMIPALGLLALLLSGLEALPKLGQRRILASVDMLLGIAGFIALALLLTTARSEPEQLLSDLGLKGAISSLMSAALVHIEPGLGYAVNVVGFVLLLFGGMAGFVMYARASR